MSKVQRLTGMLGVGISIPKWEVSSNILLDKDIVWPILRSIAASKVAG